MTTINIGHRNYGYKSIEAPCTTPVVTVNKPSIDWKKYIPVLAAGAVAAFVSLNSDPVSAAMIAPEIDIRPIEDFSRSIYWSMVKGVFWFSLPVYGWIGYVFAFSGNNSGKRSAAKITFFSLLGGTAFLIGAPWIGWQVFEITKNIFGKYMPI